MASQQNPSASSSSTEVVRDPEKEIFVPVDGAEDVEQGNERSKTAQSATDWDGPNDTGNPLNWPTWKRAYHVIPPAIISFSA